MHSHDYPKHMLYEELSYTASLCVLLRPRLSPSVCCEDSKNSFHN